jgi:hypothetical protein
MNFVEVHCNHLGIFSSYSPDLLPNDMQVIQLGFGHALTSDELSRIMRLSFNSAGITSAYHQEYP